MNMPKISRILFCSAAGVLAAVFAIRLAKGYSPITSGLWLAAAIMILILALALKPEEGKARGALIGSAVTLCAALMVLSYTFGRLAGPVEREAYAPAAPTEEPSSLDQPGFDWKYAGTYVVGKDIPAGEYIIVSHDSVRADYSIFHGYADLIAEMFSYESDCIMSSFTVEDGETLFVNGGAFISSESSYEPPAFRILFDGTYKVGREIPAGKYFLRPSNSTDSGYYEICSDNRHLPSSIIESSSFSVPFYIDLEEGQYLRLESAVLDIGD